MGRLVASHQCGVPHPFAGASRASGEVEAGGVHCPERQMHPVTLRERLESHGRMAAQVLQLLYR
jgi:hypothetical protein